MFIPGPLDCWWDTIVHFVNSEECPESEYPICISHILEPNLLQIFKKFIYFQTEQMSRENLVENIVNVSKNNDVFEIWDYSSVNVEILKKRGVNNIKHVPLKTPKFYLEKILNWKRTDNNSVGFCGGLSQRRINIFNELAKNNIKVNIIGAWGEERDEQLAKNKIILNIHFDDDYKIFEQVRCIPWITAGYKVISEVSLDDDERCINVKYDKLVETVLYFMHILD